MYMLNNYTNMGMALWIMDDGCFDTNNYHQRYILSVKRLRGQPEILNAIAAKLESLGLPCHVSLEDGSLTFNKESSTELASRISQYVPACMQYKLPENERGKYCDFSLTNSPICLQDTVNIRLIRPASARQCRNLHKFDISVANNHNYMVGGIRNGLIVHNSPETTPGGQALKYYSSHRLDLRRGEKLGDADAPEGNVLKIKCIKNKIAPPFRETEINLIYGKGFDGFTDLIKVAVDKNIIQRGGAWYSYGEQRLGQGIDNVIALLRESPELMAEIKGKLSSPIVIVNG
jgi:recombination protein RecA